MNPDETYRGVWPSEDAYIVAQLAEHLPPFLIWILQCCDPVKLRDGYCGKALIVRSRPLDDGQVMVFESVRES